MKVIFLSCVVLAALLTVGYAKSRAEYMAGDYTHLYTPDNYTYKHFSLQVLERDYIVFGIKACSDAHILLVDEISNTSHNALEVVISGWENTRSVIRDGMQANALAVADTLHILHCGEMRTFWVHWSDERVSVGRGPVYLEQAFMTAARTTNQHSIHYTAFSTGFGHTGVWEIQENTGYHMLVHTPDVTPEKFQFATKSVARKDGFMTFKARACNDLHIALGPIVGAWDYRVNLCAWSNTVHCIWVNGELYKCSEDGQFPDVCSCDEERQFWISWVGPYIKAGRGSNYKQNELIEFKDTKDVVVDFASFSTGWGATGDWVFDESTDNQWQASSRMSDNPDRSFNMWLLTTKRHFVPFHVMACQEARVAIADKPGMDSELDSYHLVIGAYGNTKTVIQQDFSVGDLYSVDTPNILHCNVSRPFWLSYWNGQVQFGHGLSYGHFRILSWTIPRTDFDTQAIGLALPGNAGYWTVKRNHVDGFAFETPPFFADDRYWQTVRSDCITYFRARGEKNLELTLARITGFTVGHTTNVLIGRQNEYTIIQDVDKNGQVTEFVREHTPSVLSPEEFRGFWVSWLDGFVRVGSGFQYGERILAETPERIWHNVNALSLSSSDVSISWEFESYSGEQIYMRTPTSSLQYKWFHMREYTFDDNDGYWFYFQVAGAEAQLLLSEHYLEPSNSYRFVIGEEYNKRVSLYKGTGKSVVAYYSGPSDLLHQYELRTFWVSWSNGRIKFGKGPYRNSNTLLDYSKAKDFNKVQGVAVAGSDSYMAYWRFYEHQGVGEFSFDTSSLVSPDQVWMSLTHRTNLVFSVRACNDVHVFLSTLMHSQDPKDQYQISIQNTEGMSSIWAPFVTNEREVELTKRVEVTTPGILNCNEDRVFWLSFGGDSSTQTIVLGKGTAHGLNALISYHSFDAVPVRAISFTSKDVISVVRVPLTTKFLAEVRDSPNDNLSGGEIAGAVLGFMALIAIFVVAVVVILRPPAPLKKYMEPPQQGAAQSQSEAANAGFDNPLAASSSDKTAHMEYDQ